MPGFYGCFGCSKEEESQLKKEFSKPWGKCEHTFFNGGIIGGHAFSEKSSLHNSIDGIIFAVDGENSIYLMAEKLSLVNRSIFADISSGNLNGLYSLKGNLVAVDKASGICHIVTEWTGTFPLFYAQIDKKFIFCSRQKPIARVLGLSPDYIGILEFFRETYMYAGRTFFNGLHRLLPGQTLSFNQLLGDLKVGESSRFWVPGEDRKIPGNICEALSEKLKNSLSKCLESDLDIALMMSGGWDSRLLLGGLLNLSNSSRVKTFVYGDSRSREINLVKKICQSARVECIVDNYGAEIYDLSLLQEGFNRSEIIIFPHWYCAGVKLAKQGVNCVTAGVYGEVLGGHYGPAMFLNGWQKIFAVGKEILGKSTHSIDIRHCLRLNGMKKPWHLKATLWNNIRNPTNLINDDIEISIQRLTDRGIRTSENLVEAFLAEHRATQYVNSQILSCRANLDIAVPFCDKELLDFSWQIPEPQKTQNTLTRDLLLRIAPNLLHYPTAATLVPAGFPIIFQEASRALRVLIDDSQYYLNWATAGRISPPTSGWINNEFLRSGPTLKNMIEDLRCDFWDKDALASSINTPEQFVGGIYTMNNLLFRFLKIYSVDLMLRQ
jgi:asparagine synthetase B (glutamine-hydrolysing)